MKLLTILTLILSIPVAAQRVVSMSPTITEIVAALGKTKQLVGVSSYCSYPEQACKNTKVGTSLTPDIEKIISLKPDFILSQEMQNSSLDRKASKIGLKIKNFKFDSFFDVKESIDELGHLLKSKEGQVLSNRLSDKFNDLKKLNKKGSFLAVVDVYEKMGRVTAVLVAGKGTFYSDLLEAAGLKNETKGSKNGEYRKVTLERLLELKEVKYFIFSPVESKKEKLLKRELKKFKLAHNQFYSFEKDYAVIPGPRLTLLIEDIIKSLK